jgi:hypothetical protein
MRWKIERAGFAAFSAALPAFKAMPCGAWLM